MSTLTTTPIFESTGFETLWTPRGGRFTSLQPGSSSSEETADQVSQLTNSTPPCSSGGVESVLKFTLSLEQPLKSKVDEFHQERNEHLARK